MKAIEDTHIEYIKEAIKRCLRPDIDEKTDVSKRRISLDVLMELIECFLESFEQKVNEVGRGLLRKNLHKPAPRKKLSQLEESKE